MCVSRLNIRIKDTYRATKKNFLKLGSISSPISFALSIRSFYVYAQYLESGAFDDHTRITSPT